MKKLLVLILLVACTTSFARLRSEIATASVGSPIPASYNISDPNSAMMQCEGVRHFMVWNTTDKRIRVHVVRSTVTPADSAPDFVWVPARGNGAWDFLPIADNATVFIRSDETAATTGEVLVTCW